MATRGYPNNHDTIFYYTRGRAFTWNRPLAKYDPDEKTLQKYSLRDGQGCRYQLTSLLNPSQDRPNLTYEFLGVTRVWRWTRDRMQREYEAGRVVQPRPGAVPRFKRLLDSDGGKPVDDVWVDIPPLNSRAAERLGYPTQKPLALLERIVGASSDPDGVVLDAFCGCGTALAAAHNLGRRWVGIDISPTACRVIATRLEKSCGLRPGKDFRVVGMPRSEEQLRRMPPFEFENWAVVSLGGVPNKTKVGDMGIDGRVFPVGAISPDIRKKPRELDFMDYWYPVQVKQKDKIGRPDVDSFEAVMTREDRPKGFMVSFGFTSDAEREIDGFFRRTGRAIVPLTVREILDEEIARKLV